MARSIRQPKLPSWQAIWHIIQFFWKGAHPQQQRTVLGGLLLLTVLSLFAGTVLVFESIQRGEFISALAARDSQRFQIALVRFVGILLLSAALLSVSAYVRDRLGLHCRKGLSRQFLNTYLADQHYYHLPTEVDNPDQRISEDIRNISQLSVIVFAIFLESGVQLIGFVGVLLSISLGLTGFLLVYALVGSAIVTWVFGMRLTRINAEQLKREANFRTHLIDIRENAESIAFYQKQQGEFSLGNTQERHKAGHQFAQVVHNFNQFIRWQFGLDCFQNGYQYLTFILPSLILAPRILAGDLEVGAIVQSQAAFDRIWLSLSLVVVQFEQLTALAASTGRLQTLLSAISSQQQAIDSALTIQIVEQPEMVVDHLTLQLPSPQLFSTPLQITQEELKKELKKEPQEKQRFLFKDISFIANAPLLITGPSGIGKSSLVKAIAGLLKQGRGTIGYPHDDILFLPQQPYMAVGTLRQQLIYPTSQSPHSDEVLLNILNQVQLTEFTNLDQALDQALDQVLDQVKDWSGTLSTGEQQRLAFARLFVRQPTYAILDEATSALSIQQEKALYQQLAATNITFISIGHRPSLLAYHPQVLVLTDSNTWELRKSDPESTYL